MSTVVLVGFSTTGKSTILREIENQYGNLVKTIDTDEVIAREWGNHIFNIYLDLVEGRERNKAIKYIKKREEEILGGFVAEQNPCLIAAGPGLPLRKEDWAAFLNRVKPVCIFLKMSADQIYYGLIKRRAKHQQIESIVSKNAFGSWDEGVITRFCDGKWVPVDPEDAIANIQKLLDERLEFYPKDAEVIDAAELRNKDGAVYKKFYKCLANYLGGV